MEVTLRLKYDAILKDDTSGTTESVQVAPGASQAAVLAKVLVAVLENQRA